MAKPRKATQIERRMQERGVYDVDEFDAWLAGRCWSWHALDRGDYGISVEEAAVLFTIEDPVRWAETFLIEPDTLKPYTLFDYQKPSIRAFAQDVVHEDGAEVGKTREIVVLTLWTCCTGQGGRIRRPSMLIGAPQQVFLDDIARAIEAQVGVVEGDEWESKLRQHWLKPILTPHKLFRFRCLNPADPKRPTVAEVHFRPAGHDGTAFRGVHVNAIAIMEEAAKCKEKVQWTEFYRALLPGCALRSYSVPDGDRNTEYHRLCVEAVENLPPEQPGFRKFRWPKTLMPPPFWSEARRLHFVKLYGGADTAGYKRNVLGEWGDAENPVIRWDVLLPNVVDLPDYRRITIGADGTAETLYLDVARIDLQIVEGRKHGRESATADAALGLAEFIGRNDAARMRAWRELLAPHLGHIDPRGVHWVGCDLGERNDPTEIIVSEAVGEELRDVLRVKAKGLPYHAQCDLIHEIDRATGHRAFWGVDLGSAGTAVVKSLLNVDAYKSAGFEERLFGFHFQETVECIDEDGNALTQEDEHGDREVLSAPAKHWSTVCVVSRLQQHGYRIAYDSDVLNDYTSHTAKEGKKWPIYAKKDDHTIDARRQQMLAKLRMVEGNAPDVFSSSVFQRIRAA